MEAQQPHRQPHHIDPMPLVGIMPNIDFGHNLSIYAQHPFEQPKCINPMEIFQRVPDIQFNNDIQDFKYETLDCDDSVAEDPEDIQEDSVASPEESVVSPEEVVIPPPTQKQIRIHMALLERLTRQDKRNASYQDRFQVCPKFAIENQAKLPYQCTSKLELQIASPLYQKWQPIFKNLSDQIETKFWTGALEFFYDHDIKPWAKQCKNMEFRGFDHPQRIGRNLKKLESKYVEMGHKFLELNDILSTDWIRQKYDLGYFLPCMRPPGILYPWSWVPMETWNPALPDGTEFSVIDSKLYVTWKDVNGRRLALCQSIIDKDGKESFELIDKPLRTRLKTTLKRFEKLEHWRRKSRYDSDDE